MPKRRRRLACLSTYFRTSLVGVDTFDSNVWWVWQWLFIVIKCIVLEDSDDSDDDSNLSDDFDEIKN